jgi:uncharacterized protein YegJ (DUF2314 family)
MLQNDIVYTNESPQMLDAYKKAQSTFKYFWRELWWERRRIVPALGLSCVKAVFYQENPTGQPPVVEFMWISDIDFDGLSVNGFLINSPDDLTNIKQGDLVKIPIEEIKDWLFAINKRAYGGFTVQVTRAEMSKKERKEHDKAWGLDFGDSNKILVAYEQDKHPENLTEHPMSINMNESLKRFLIQNPNELTQKDEFGYTMLHRETIAGNKSIVETLLQMGADINATTNSGYTALDFAKKLEWEHLAYSLVNTHRKTSSE